jgi:hypothetical protein
MLSEVFWTFLITSTIGLCLGIARMLYKSKCKSFSCCGLRIERDVEMEVELDARETEQKEQV